jgi:hypothetical protein
VVVDPLDALDAGLEAKATPPPAPAPQRLGDLLDAAMGRMQRRADALEKPIPLPWKSMEEQLGGGLWPGLHVLVGGTGTGKSQWALQAALHAAKAGTPVLYVGLELGEVDLVARLLGEEARTSWSGLFLGTPGALLHARNSADALRNLPLHLEFGTPTGWPASRLRAAAEEVRTMYPQKQRGERPFLVVLDFLQIVGDEPDARGTDLRQRIGQAAYAARDIARNMDAAVLLVSSTARQNYGTVAGKEPGPMFHDDHRIGGVDALVGMGKESGEIEYAADSVTVAVRWQGDLPERRPGEGQTAVIFATAKVRAGKPRWTELRFNGWRFSEPEGGDQALVAAMAQARQQPDTGKREKAKAEAALVKEEDWGK